MKRKRPRPKMIPATILDLPPIDERGRCRVTLLNAPTLADVDPATVDAELDRLRYPRILLGGLPPGTRILATEIHPDDLAQLMRETPT